MRILVAGGGPGGLYFAILMKKAQPDCNITVVERNPRGVTFGWGVVFSDETLGNLLDADPATHGPITRNFAHWDAIDTHFGGERIRSVGHGFSGIARKGLLDILVERAESLGVDIQFGTELDDFAIFDGYDLVVAADGVNSRIRSAHAAAFGPEIEMGTSKFIWLGTEHLFDAFTFVFEPGGSAANPGFLVAHAYRFDAGTSTFIVETDEETWREEGFDELPIPAAVAKLEKKFAPYIGGRPLLADHATWRNFPTVRCKSWHHRNIVLIGDAAHTAHFSIGSGTKLAMEDAILLTEALTAHPHALEQALVGYEADRRSMVARIQKAAETSRRWFETTRRHGRLSPRQLTFSMMTRSKRITYENLRLRDPALVTEAARELAARELAAAGVADVPSQPPQPMFLPLRLRELTLVNRVVVSPMCQYSAVDGTPNDWHLVHLGSRAVGGAGLVFTEMTDVAADARISPGCTGIYSPEHVVAWRRIVDFVHAHSRAAIGIQLAHAGRKGSTCAPWEGMDAPLATGNWPLISASPLPYLPGSQVPREMNPDDMARVRDEFVRAARLSQEAGFDLIELHMAHGYLLGSFLSPVTNRRTDSFGGDVAGRMRYPLEVFDAVRAVWPAAKPMAVRISACDWVEGGITMADTLAIARALKERGLDLLDVSAGQTTPEQQPVYGRMFQTPFSEEIRNEVGLRTITVGNIQNADQINTIVAAGRADLAALARPHLADPYFTLHAASDAGHDSQHWPSPYLAAKPRPRPPAKENP